jgi:hypothetical protein
MRNENNFLIPNDRLHEKVQGLAGRGAAIATARYVTSTLFNNALTLLMILEQLRKKVCWWGAYCEGLVM